MSCDYCQRTGEAAAATGGLGRTFSRARWSTGRTDVRGWYEERRRQGDGRPVVAVAAPLAPAPPQPSVSPREQAVLELLRRDIPADCWCREAILDPLNPGESHAITWHIRQADEVYCYSDDRWKRVTVVVRTGCKAYAFCWRWGGGRPGDLAVLALGRSARIEYADRHAAHRAFLAERKRDRGKNVGYREWHCYICGAFLLHDGLCEPCGIVRQPFTDR